jgi:hypothetical protein
MILSRPGRSLTSAVCASMNAIAHTVSSPSANRSTRTA